MRQRTGSSALPPEIPARRAGQAKAEPRWTAGRKDLRSTSAGAASRVKQARGRLAENYSARIRREESSAPAASPRNSSACSEECWWGTSDTRLLDSR